MSSRKARPRKNSRGKTVTTVISKIADRTNESNAALIVIYGEALGRKYDLVNPLIEIGRSKHADIQLDEEAVSRSHARLTCGSRVVLEDLSSTNGTFVNDLQIRKPRTLVNGDFVKVGRTLFKFLDGTNIEAAYHDEIYRLMTVDGLTLAHNRRYFDEALEREVSRSQRYARNLSLVLMDIDCFKDINDEFGHLAGDHILKELSTAVMRRIRREDIFARYGGEEFALLLPELDLKQAVKTAEKARRLLEQQRFSFDGETIRVTVSMGVATRGNGKNAKGELLQRADERLYEAKQSGRNRVCG